MSKRKQEEIVVYGRSIDPNEISSDELEANYEYAGRAEDGTILVRRKKNTDSGTQKAADGLAAWLGLFLGGIKESGPTKGECRATLEGYLGSHQTKEL